MLEITDLNQPHYIIDGSGPQAGSLIYTDRDYCLLEPIPDFLRRGILIRTANEDKVTTSSTEFLNFTINAPARVHVALDDRIVPPPSWLVSWTKMTGYLMTSDPNPERIIYWKDFPAGKVSLGANHLPSTPRTYSMYSVIVVPSMTNAREWVLYGE